MKTLLLPALFLALLMGIAQARIGETEQQLIARYGNEISKGQSWIVGGNSLPQVEFQKSGFKITVLLFHGLAADERFSKVHMEDALNDEETQTLLTDDDGAHHAWNKSSDPWLGNDGTRDGDPYPTWRREDGEAVAQINQGSSGERGLEIKSTKLNDYIKAAWEKEHASSLDGF